MRQIIHLSPTQKSKKGILSGQVKTGRESAQSVRVSGSTAQGEVTSAAPTNGQFLRPEPALLLEDRRSRRLARRLWSQKAIVMAELKPDEEFMVVVASYSLCGAGTP
jgi:hypothetical protein